jgi:hypothetical protein
LQIQRECLLLDRVVQVARQTLAFGDRGQLRARTHQAFNSSAMPSSNPDRRPSSSRERSIDAIAEVAAAPCRRGARHPIEPPRHPGRQEYR